MYVNMQPMVLILTQVYKWSIDTLYIVRKTLHIHVDQKAWMPSKCFAVAPNISQAGS